MAEGQRGSTPLLHPFPCLCCLFGQGCPRGVRLSRQREAEWHTPPQLEGWSATEEMGRKGQSTSPSPGRGGGSAALPSKGVKARKKPKETEDDGGRRSPAIHPLAFWVLVWVAALASAWEPCFELLLARDGGAAGFGTGRGDRAGGYFPLECLRIQFPHCVVTNVSIRECVCVRARVCLGGCVWEGYFRVLMVAQCGVQLPVLPPPQVPLSAFGDDCPPALGRRSGRRGQPHHPASPPHRIPNGSGVAQPAGGDTAGMGCSPCAKWETL